MTAIRIPGYCEGDDLSGEPVNWVIYDPETKERRIEWNPKYVPPPPLTRREELENEIASLQRDLADLEDE